MRASDAGSVTGPGKPAKWDSRCGKTRDHGKWATFSYRERVKKIEVKVFFQDFFLSDGIDIDQSRPAGTSFSNSHGQNNYKKFWRNLGLKKIRKQCLWPHF